jgi:hypothetical protein
MVLHPVKPAGVKDQIADQGLWGLREIESPDLFFKF